MITLTTAAASGDGTTAGRPARTRTRVTTHAPTSADLLPQPDFLGFTSRRHHRKGARPLNVTARTRDATGNDQRRKVGAGCGSQAGAGLVGYAGQWARRLRPGLAFGGRRSVLPFGRANLILT